MEVHFGNHPLSMSVLGSAESITQLERDQMADYFKQPLRAGEHGARRSPGNSSLMRSCKLAEKYCGDWPRVERAARAAAADVQAAARATDRRQAQPPVHDGHDARPQRQDDRRFAARVLADVIGDSDGSRFYWALVDNAIAEDADFGFYPARRLRQLLHLAHHRSRPHRQGAGHRAEGTGKGQDRSEGRRGRARQEQDRQQPGPQGEVPIGRMRHRRASGSTTTNTARSNRTWPR